MRLSHRRSSVLFFFILILGNAHGFAAGGIKSRAFMYTPDAAAVMDKPKLIIICGGPGTGKSTFGMSLALDQGILKCISTDTVRAVMRSYVPVDICPALHRSSYEKSVGAPDDDDPVRSWKETCRVLESSVEGLVNDAIQRRVSLVLEGVSIIPSNKWINQWEEAGGVATGVLLTVPKEEVHKALLLKRGFTTGNDSAEQQKIKSFDRVRLIQKEMIRLAKMADWVLIEQKVEPDPLEVVAEKLLQGEDCINSFKTLNINFNEEPENHHKQPAHQTEPPGEEESTHHP